MKIRTFRFIDNGVYGARLYTEDWSQLDRSCIHKFGDPEVDLGGTFNLFPAVTGTHDSVDVRDYIVDSTKNQGPTLDFRSKDLTGRPVYNATKDFWGVVSGWTDDPATTIFVSSGAGDRWDFGDVYIVHEVSFILPARYRRAMGQTPFEQRFDFRTYGSQLVYGDANQYAYQVPQYFVPVADMMAKAWADEMQLRIEFAVAVLRANTDGYTTEEIDTV
jgi:hypothetical protein